MPIGSWHLRKSRRHKHREINELLAASPHGVCTGRAGGQRRHWDLHRLRHLSVGLLVGRESAMAVGRGGERLHRRLTIL